MNGSLLRRTVMAASTLMTAAVLAGASAPAMGDGDKGHKKNNGKHAIGKANRGQGANGNRYGWERGVGNPHREDQRDYQRRYSRRYNDDRWLREHFDASDHRRLHGDLQRRHRQWHADHPNNHRDDRWERSHERFHADLDRSHRQYHRRSYRQAQPGMSDGVRRLIGQLNERHRIWHNRNDGRRDPQYDDDHRDLHRQLDAYYQRMRRSYS